MCVCSVSSGYALCRQLRRTVIGLGLLRRALWCRYDVFFSLWGLNWIGQRWGEEGIAASGGAAGFGGFGPGLRLGWGWTCGVSSGPRMYNTKWDVWGALKICGVHALTLGIDVMYYVCVPPVGMGVC